MHSNDSSYHIFEIPVFASDKTIIDVLAYAFSSQSQNCTSWLPFGIFVQSPQSAGDPQTIGFISQPVVLEQCWVHMQSLQACRESTAQPLSQLISAELFLSSKKPTEEELRLKFYEDNQEVVIFKEGAGRNTLENKPQTSGVVTFINVISRATVFKNLIKDYYVLLGDKSQLHKKLQEETQTKYLQELELSYTLSHIRLNNQELGRQYDDNHFINECRKKIEQSVAAITNSIFPTQSTLAISELQKSGEYQMKSPSKVSVTNLLNSAFSDLQSVLTSEGHGLVLDVCIEGYLFINQLQLTRALQLLVLAWRQHGTSDFNIIARINNRADDESTVTISLVAEYRKTQSRALQQSCLYFDAALEFAQQAVTAHHGSLFHSATDQKQIIDIEIPLYQSSYQQHSLTIERVDEHKPKRRALVVDDDIDIQNYITSILADMGFETFSANDGFDGLLIVERFSPQFVFTDLRMPKLNGIEFLKKIHTPQRPCIKVLMTGISPQYLKTELMEDVADFILTKPIATEQILQIITAVSASKST